MLKLSGSLVGLFGLICASLSADEATSAPNQTIEQNVEEAPVDVSKISESFGHLIGKNIETIGFQLDLALVIKGLQDQAAGKESPLNEMECFQAISSVQEGIFKKQAAENLVKADDFLANNSKIENVVSLEEGKLQYKIEQKGEGTSVEEHFSPLIRYVGKFIDGQVFGASKEDEMISLDDAIVGFSKGLVGMKEGEKRTLYIHPDLGYGSNSGYMPPNSLLTFEVELIKANQPKKAENDALTSQDASKTGSEVATTPGSGKDIVR